MVVVFVLGKSRGVQASLELAVGQGIALCFCSSCLYFLSARIIKWGPPLLALAFLSPRISHPSTVMARSLHSPKYPFCGDLESARFPDHFPLRAAGMLGISHEQEPGSCLPGTEVTDWRSPSGVPSPPVPPQAFLLGLLHHISCGSCSSPSTSAV